MTSSGLISSFFFFAEDYTEFFRMSAAGAERLFVLTRPIKFSILGILIAFPVVDAVLTFITPAT